MKFEAKIILSSLSVSGHSEVLTGDQYCFTSRYILSTKASSEDGINSDMAKTLDLVFPFFFGLLFRFIFVVCYGNVLEHVVVCIFFTFYEFFFLQICSSFCEDMKI